MEPFIAFTAAFYFGVFNVTTVWQLRRMMFAGVPFLAAVPLAFLAGAFWPGVVALKLSEN